MGEFKAFFEYLSKMPILFNLEPVHCFFRPGYDSKQLAQALKNAKPPLVSEILLLYTQSFPDLEIVD